MTVSAPSSKSSPKRRPARGPSPQEYREFSVAHQNVILERMDKKLDGILIEQILQRLKFLEQRVLALEGRAAS